MGILTPEGTLLDSMSITVTSADPTVAEVRACGVIGRIYVVTGVNEGRTTLTVEAQDLDSGRILTAHCKVTVGQACLTLPAGLTVIGDEAFRGTAADEAVIPERVTSIGSKAFADHDGPLTVTVYARSLTIAPDAFENCPNLTVYGCAGSDVETYCGEKEIPFAAIG